MFLISQNFIHAKLLFCSCKYIRMCVCIFIYIFFLIFFNCTTFNYLFILTNLIIISYNYMVVFYNFPLILVFCCCCFLCEAVAIIRNSFVKNIRDLWYNLWLQVFFNENIILARKEDMLMNSSIKKVFNTEKSRKFFRKTILVQVQFSFISSSLPVHF